MNKIIQLEKDRQEEYFSRVGKAIASAKNVEELCCKVSMDEHRQSLINLKEYMEGELKWECDSIGYVELAKECEPRKETKITKEREIEKDIEELNKMIKKYGE